MLCWFMVRNFFDETRIHGAYFAPFSEGVPDIARLASRSGFWMGWPVFPASGVVSSFWFELGKKTH